MADNFQLNIDAVENLISSPTNKVLNGEDEEEGVAGEYQEELDLSLTDEELLELKRQYETDFTAYYPSIQKRSERNKTYLVGMQKGKQVTRDTPVSSNLLFEATATFIPQALAENPEPVVWSDNTPEGKLASKGLKTMLQFHADQFLLRMKLAVQVWHWSVYFIGVIKYGWDDEIKDITCEVRNPKNFLFDPSGYVDEYGDFTSWVGERIEVTAKRLIELYPGHKDYITIKANAQLGTKLIYTEWWTDKYCFRTFFDVVLDKHKNEFFNYDKNGKSEEEGGEEEFIEAHNHFATPKMPYTFLSVFSMQEQPHDITNLIEQNIANQDQINDRDIQIDKNLRNGNNSIAISGVSFNQETARQAAQALEDGDPVLVPDGRVEEAIKRLPANSIPDAVFRAQEINKDTLRSVYGTQGITAVSADSDTTAHGEVINSNRDSSRIGGGIGDRLEQVAKNFFNKLTQMYYVFYDEPHYASVMGNGAAVSYIKLAMTDEARRFVVGVAPNSMKPKDEVTEQNLATQLATEGLLDPLTFFERIDDPDPQDTAEKVVMYKLSPQLYFQTYFPEAAQAQQQAGLAAQPQGDGVPNEPGSPPTTLSGPTDSSSLPPLPANTQPQL